MSKNRYFENLSFSGGKRINVSERIDTNFQDMDHWHSYAEILVSMCDGNQVTVNFVPYTLKTSDIIFIYSGSLHSVRYVKEDSFLVIQFPLELLTGIQELRAPVFALSSLPLISYDPRLIECSEMQLFINELRQAALSEDPFGEALIYTLLLRLFISIGRMLRKKGVQLLSAHSRNDDKNADLITEACLYISENCTEPLTLDSVSRHIGMSKSHFAHLFRFYTNRTFIDFLTEERIKRSETFFLNPKMHIVDIAFESGFSSISSFNRSFRRVKGCSPTEFRKTRVD